MSDQGKTAAPLCDMHCHLGFIADAEDVRRCVAASGHAALSCTVDPAGFERDGEIFAETPRVRVALGLHPWRVADGEAGEHALARFEELAPAAPFIGEIGLDFAGERGCGRAREAQMEALDRALSACTGSDKAISLHAVRSANTVLDLLESHGACERHRVMFHWFSGTSAELKRAIEAGCSFSVGPRMLATKRGREYARIIPERQLLLETDSPSRPGERWDCAEWGAQLRLALDQLAAIRGAEPSALAANLAERSLSLLREG